MEKHGNRVVESDNGGGGVDLDGREPYKRLRARQRLVYLENPKIMNMGDVTMYP